MNKLLYLLPLGLTTCMGCTGKDPMTKKVEGRRPNVLLILADDIGYGDLGCYGTSSVKTPNVDRLASEGIMFTDAHCTSATSTPSATPCLQVNTPGGRAEPA